MFNFQFFRFVAEYFGKCLNPSFITKFLRRHFLSLKLVGNASVNEVSNREKIINEAVLWLDSFEQFSIQYDVTPEQIKAIDKTYLCTSPWHKNVRHIGPKGSIKSRKVTSSRGQGIIIMLLYYIIIELLLYTLPYLLVLSIILYIILTYCIIISIIVLVYYYVNFYYIILYFVYRTKIIFYNTIFHNVCLLLRR
jgi:hypothetical protein